MGIRGMQSFLERTVPGGCTSVDIMEKAREHERRCPPDKRPTIVVDGLSLIKWIYNQTDNFIFGGPWEELVHILTQEFVRPFQERGIDLVFFFDGQVCQPKAAEWRIRREKRLQDIKSTFERLRKRTWTGKDQDDYCCPNGTSFTLCFAAKCLTNCRVFYALEECDLEAARYADKHPECFALLGQDTDFVMFNMRVLYLSTLNLNTHTLTTKAYHPGALAHHLQLAPHQLPLFACLAGNDTISLDALEKFHRSIGCGPEQRVNPAGRFHRIATAMRKQGWNGVPDAAVAGGACVHLALLQEGVSLYDVTLPSRQFVPSSPHIDEDSWRVVVNAYMEARTLPALLQVLYSREVYLGETMEEIIDQGIAPAHSCFRPVRRKMYWVLYGGSDQVTVTEHVAFPGSMGIRDEAVTPLTVIHRPAGWVPPLRRLWSPDPSLDHTRWLLWCKCIGEEVDMGRVRSLPERYVMLACTLRLMFRVGVLSDRELAAFLLQAVLPDRKHQWLMAWKTPKEDINPHMVTLATYFMIGVTNLAMALSACGQPMPLPQVMPWRYFSGKILHIIHALMPEQDARYILEYDDTLISVYQRLEDFIRS